MIDKIIVGEIDENGNKNPNVIKFILKTGKNYDFLIDNQKHCMSFCKRNKWICDRHPEVSYFWTVAKPWFGQK